MLLDREILHRLKTEPSFVMEVLNKQAMLVHPVGFIDGINPFNAPTLEDVRDKMTEAMTQLESLREAHPNASTEELIGQVLLKNVLAELRGIDERLLSRLHVISPPTLKSDFDISTIAANLNGSPGMTEADVTEVISKLHESQRPLAREAVAQLSEVQSHRSMAALARAQFDKVVSYARSEGVAPEDIIFAVSGFMKSYCLANYIFKEANACKLSPGQFVSTGTLGQAVIEKGQRKSLVVALDDFSGSGASLLSNSHTRGEIRCAVGQSVPIVCAPYVATTKAFEFLEAVRKDDPHVTMIPGRVVASAHQSQLAHVNNGALKLALDLVIGPTGYGGAGSFVSLPYMGPDNNCALFGGEYFNPYFILNRRKTAALIFDKVTWNPGNNEVFADVVKREIELARGDLDTAAAMSLHAGLRMLERIEQLTVWASSVSILEDSQANIQALATDLAENCRDEVRRVAERARNAPNKEVSQQLCFDFAAARELSRRLILHEIGGAAGDVKVA